MADIVLPGETAGVINDEHMPQNFDIMVYRGNDADFTVTLKNSTGTPLDLTGATAKAQVKVSYADSNPIDLVCTNLGNGQVRIQLPAATSATMLPGAYIWDFKVTYSSTSARTYVTGDITVLDRVTA